MHALDHAIAALATAQAGAFARSQAVALGASRSTMKWRLDSGRWIRLAREVYGLPGHAPTPEHRMWVAHLEAGERSVLSHACAVTALGVPGFERASIDVTVVRGGNHSLATGRLHETSWLPAHHVVRVPGLPPLTSLARCIFDLAGDPAPHLWRTPHGRDAHTRRIGRALDTALARLGLSLAAQIEVVAALGKRGRPGSAIMRVLLDERGDGYRATESELEDLFLGLVDAHGLPRPVRQLQLGAQGLLARVDFAYPERRLVIEVDGRKYHTALSDLEHDRRRDNALMAAGWRVIRFTWWDIVREPDRVVALLREALRLAAG